MAALRRRSYTSEKDETKNIVEHFERVLSRMEEIIRQSKLLLSVLKKKLSVDKDHVKAIQKMTQSMHEDTHIRHLVFEGTMDAHWSSIKDKLGAEAMRVSSVASTLEQQSMQPLQVYVLADLDKRFHNLIQDGRKLVKDYMATRTTLFKTKEKYYSVAAEWESSLLALYQECGDSWNPAPGNKLYEKEISLCRKMEEGKAEYEAVVSHTNTVQIDVLCTHLPQVLDSLRSIAQSMVAVINNSLKCFSKMQSMLLQGQKQSEEIPEQFNAAEYCQKVVFNSIKMGSIPYPQPYVFEEYPFADHTLMIQTRKVQYQCMSKLSAKELANRAHQFLANGDKKKNAIQPVQETAINIMLVTTCLEYLHQPLALKEEGLFRVSGDNSLMRTMLADFANGKATKEFLRQAVMSQKDPNNVSGLLKMHLREHHLLSKQSAAVIQTVIAPGMNDVLGSVLKLSPMELQLLKHIFELLHTMVQEQWCSQNKMSANTLGIACGLSLFPQLDPAKATAFTSYLIDNYNQLMESHL